MFPDGNPVALYQVMQLGRTSSTFFLHKGKKMNKNEAIEVIKELNHLAIRFVHLVQPIRNSGGSNSAYDIVDKIVASIHKIQESNNIPDNELEEILKV